MLSVYDLLGAQGPFANQLIDFSPRLQQQEMAQAIEAAFDNNQVLIAEAGTGTGKTFAYLVPALLKAQFGSKKIIISTGTKNLQDQLYHRDLPVVIKALGASVKVAILKGRANYLCHYRFEQKERQGHLTLQQLKDFSAIKQWLPTSHSGDIGELACVPEDASIWPFATSSADNCLGTDCPNLSDCFVMKARKLAQQADVVVINHHLFFADMALRDEGFGEVLPGANAFIFDEAHQLADTATQFFGTNLSGRQLFELTKDSRTEVLQEAPDIAEIHQLTDELDTAVKDFRLALGEPGQRVAWARKQQQQQVSSLLARIVECCEDLELCLKEAAVRSAGIEKCWRRAADILYRLGMFELSDTEAKDSELKEVIWCETHAKGFTLHKTPTQIADQFSSYIESQPGAWVFTSATLAVAGRFEHFSQSLGLEAEQAHSWGSPFDYSRQALLYIPESMPQPNTMEYISAVADVAREVIKSSEGRTFILVTSYKALNEIARQLTGSVDYPLLVQGEQSRGELLDTFRRLGNAILIGTSSFWEGVDVKGQALSCVIIDKLPFAAPDDPILQARIEAMQKHGKNPFMEIQLPRAVISLKQGVGRLIRDVSDTGALVICDPRMFSKSYGKIFLDSLPDMIKTRKLEKVAGFFRYTKSLQLTTPAEDAKVTSSCAESSDADTSVNRSDMSEVVTMETNPDNHESTGA